MKGRIWNGWAGRARLIEILIAGFIFSFALFYSNPASANWARSLSDTELDTVFAGRSVRFTWSTTIRLADRGGRFKFNFIARGTIRPRGTEGRFDSEVALLGGLVNVNIGNSGSSGSGSSGSGSGHSHFPEVKISASVENGGSSESVIIGNPSGNFIQVSVSAQSDGGSDSGSGSGSDGGSVNLRFGEREGSNGNSIVTFNGLNVDSQLSIDVSLIQNTVGRGAGRGRMTRVITRTIRRSLCLGCP